MLNRFYGYFQEDTNILDTFCNQKTHCYTRYKENVEATLGFYDDESLKKRIEYMKKTFPGSLWHSETHRRYMYELDYLLGYHKSRNTRHYYAAMYLLTVNDDLIERTAYCFNRDGIDFSKVRIKGISVQNYDLLMAARQIYTGKRYIFQEDLAYPEIIDDDTFRLIMNAHIIMRMGIGALNK